MAMNFKEAVERVYHLDSKRLNDYLSVKNGFLYYRDIKLMDLIKKYGAPLEVAFCPMITEKVNYLQKQFDIAIKKYGYSGKFIYAYATKASYYEEVLRTALKSGAHIETTSAYDMDIVNLLHHFRLLPEDRLIICNGFKVYHYAEKILELRQKGIKNICPIIENFDEINIFNKTRNDLIVGLRLKVDITASSVIKTNIENRFGFAFNDIKKAVREIKKYKKLKLKILHAHVGSQITNMKVYINALNYLVTRYCILKKTNPSLEYLDIGGGLPAQYDLNFRFDYKKFCDLVVKNVKSICSKYNISEPHLIGEFGRYTVNDHGFYIFKIILNKPSHSKDVSWYMINGSLMSSLPDCWALKQRFIVLPINNWNSRCKKVYLGGITCDPDDVYHYDEKDKIIIMPEIKNELYIGFFGIGAYQEIISGIGGVHHCLMPEPAELIVSRKKDGTYKYHNVSKYQSVERILTLLSYHRYLYKLRRGFSYDFKEKFLPIKYLDEYYSIIGHENDELLKFFESTYSKYTKENAKMLEIGGGPTIYQLISASLRVKSIDFSDFNRYNRSEVDKWLGSDRDAFDWTPYFEHVLKIRGESVSRGKIRYIENRLKKRVKRVLHCDIFKKDPVGIRGRNYYDIISVNFCPESSTDDEGEYLESIKNITSTLKSGGLLVMTALYGAESYKIFDMQFPAYRLTGNKLKKILSKYYNDIRFNVISAEDIDHKYKGIILLTAIKK